MDEAAIEVGAAADSGDGVAAFFLTRAGRAALFALHYTPVDPVTRGLVVHVHPFADEMNKCRRMAALQARALASAGYAVLQVDLSGCGDSGGEFADATWEDWVADVVAACAWLRRRHVADCPDLADQPLWLWATRSGCLVAAQAAARLEVPCNFVFWQPSLRGDQVLSQFLRLASAANVLTGATASTRVDLKAELAAGSHVHVAGYRLPPALAAGLGSALLRPPPGARRALWIEVVSGDHTVFSAPGEQAVQRWRDAGVQVTTGLVRGPQFWQTVEVEEAPALLQATLEAMSEPGAPALRAQESAG